MERAADLGLLGLAASDLAFCLAVLPHSVVDKDGFEFSQPGFALLYLTHGDAVINTFLLSSSYMTVLTGVQRYLAVCRPLQARRLVGRRCSQSALALVFLLALLFNLPRFWVQEVDRVPCTGGGFSYFISPGWMKRSGALTGYLWTFFFVGIVVPFLVLSFSNVQLIRALRRARRERAEITHGHTRRHHDNSQAINLTLVIIIVVYVVCVCPAEFINFLKKLQLEAARGARVFDLAIAVVNSLHAFAFSFNFALYCLVNRSFRQTVIELCGLVCCNFCRQPDPRRTCSMKTEITRMCSDPQENNHLQMVQLNPPDQQVVRV